MENGNGPDRLGPPAGELSRRDFVRGAAATGLVVVGAGYVKPSLKLAGVTRLTSATSTPPPPPPTVSLHGCTPGFWGNSGANGTAAGVAWWDQSADPQWGTSGGLGTNPFSHGTLFNSFFTPHTALAGLTMWNIVSGGAGSVAAQQAGRQLIAAYLNAAFGSYQYTTTQLRTMWTAAVAGGNTALGTLATLLDATNLSCDGGA